MSIVTISRGSASGGQMLAERLAKTLGFELVTREDIVREAAGYGASEDNLREALLRPPGFWERFTRDRMRYLTFMQAAICERVKEANAVYAGNAGHLLLPGISHVCCIRLIAPLPQRIHMLQEREGMSYEDAERCIRKADHERQAWTRFLYDVDWLDPSLYDLVINLRTLDMAGAVEVAATAARRIEFAPTEESRQAMADLHMASRVRAALAANKGTENTEVDVKAQRGRVRLKGRLSSPALVEAVIQVASAVDGVDKVDREDLDSPAVLV